MHTERPTWWWLLNGRENDPFGDLLDQLKLSYFPFIQNAYFYFVLILVTGAPMNPPLVDNGEDPHPSLSDWHDYEPNLEFDDTELSQTAPEPGGTVIFDEDNFSGEFIA